MSLLSNAIGLLQLVVIARSPASEIEPLMFEQGVRRFSGVVALLGVLAGCGSQARGYVGYTKLEPGTPYWVAYDSNRRGGLILVNSKKAKDASGKGTEEETFQILSCSEPPPDSAGTEALAAGIKAQQPGAGTNVAAHVKRDQGVVVLAHRSEDVEMLRESYFRLCELSLREGWTPTVLNQKYVEVLSVYRQVVSARTAAECYKAQAALASMKAEAAASMNCAAPLPTQQVVTNPVAASVDGGSGKQ